MRSVICGRAQPAAPVGARNSDARKRERRRKATRRTQIRESLQIAEAAFDERHGRVAKTRGDLGDILIQLESYEEAEPLLLSSHELYLEGAGAEHRRTKNAAKRLVKLYDAWGRPRQAEAYRVEEGETSRD